MTRSIKWVSKGMGFALALISAGVASAATIYDSAGFELPRFVAGYLNGQDPLQGPWQSTGSTASTAVVQTAVKQAGLQAVQLNRAAIASGDVRYAVQKPLVNPTGAVAVDWDMNVTRSSLPATSFGPFMGVEGYDALDNGGAGPLLAGSLGVDATTGEVLYQQTGTGFLLAVPGFTVGFGQWNHYKLLLDYNTNTY